MVETRRKCEWCGAEFTTVHRRKIYCSQECFKKAKAKNRKDKTPKVTRKCRFCKKEFTVSQDNRKFCSKECAAEFTHISTVHQHSRQCAQRRLAGDVSTVKAVCSWCDKTFSRPKGSKLKYCCAECKRLATNDMQNAGYMRRKLGVELEKTSPEKAVKVETVCPVCGGSFIPKTSRNRYCSHVCQWIAAQERHAEKYREFKGRPKCRNCGKEAGGWTSYFCSRECFDEYTVKMLKQAQTKHVCPICKTEFFGRAGMKYCSPRCVNAATYERHKKRLARMTPEEREAHRLRNNEVSRNYRKRMKEEYYGSGRDDEGVE